MSLAESTCRFEELEHGILCVSLRTSLNDAAWTEIEEIGSSIVARIHQRANPLVLVDLSGLRHMGSSLVALVVKIWKATEERGGKMVVCNQSDLVSEVLQISGLSDRWTIVSSRDQAISELSTRAPRQAGTSWAAPLAVASLTLLIVSIALLADDLMQGAISARLGSVTTSMACILTSGLALLFGVLAVLKGAGTLRMIAASLATLSAVTLIGAVVLLVNGPAKPALEVRPTPEVIRPAPEVINPVPDVTNPAPEPVPATVEQVENAVETGTPVPPTLESAIQDRQRALNDPNP